MSPFWGNDTFRFKERLYAQHGDRGCHVTCSRRGNHTDDRNRRLRTVPGFLAADILATGALADLAAGVLPGSAAGGILATSAASFDHGRFGRFRHGFGFGGLYGYGGYYGYYGYGYDSCYVLTPSGYVWVCY